MPRQRQGTRGFIAPMRAAMRYVLVGLAFGAAWAATQLLRGEPGAPAGLVLPVLLCGAFGGLLWALRVLVARLARRSRSAR